MRQEGTVDKRQKHNFVRWKGQRNLINRAQKGEAKDLNSKSSKRVRNVFLKIRNFPIHEVNVHIINLVFSVKEKPLKPKIFKDISQLKLSFMVLLHKEFINIIAIPLKKV